MLVQDDYVLGLLAQGKRIDGRTPEEFRSVTIDKGVIEKAEGSARVRLGETEVIVGVKMGVGTPFPDTPDEGVLIVGAELHPLASEQFELGPPREGSIELARVVDRGIRESKAIDTKKLCIEKGEKVWMVNIDIHIINHAGNLLDAAGLAAIAALIDAQIPGYNAEENKIDYDTQTGPLPIATVPIAVTLYKLGKNGPFVLDPVLDEENVIDSRITVTTNSEGKLCALQKGMSGLLSPEEMYKAFDLSVSKGAELRALVQK